MPWLRFCLSLFMFAAAMSAHADSAIVHITGMGVGQVIDHDRPLAATMDYTANTLYHDDPFTVGQIVIRMPKNAVREEWSDAQFRQAIANEMRAQMDAHWRADRRQFEVHLIQDDTLLQHLFHEFSDIQDDVAKFSRAAYGAIGDVLAEREMQGHKIAVDMALGSNDTAGFALATSAWQSWEHMIRRVTLVDGRAPMQAVRVSLDILGGPRVRIVNSQFDAPAAPDWIGVFQNIAFLGNSEQLHAEYPGMQLLWVRPTEELVFSKGHIRTLVRPHEEFEISLYLGNGYYADIGNYTGRDIHPRLAPADYARFGPSGAPPVGRGRTPIRGLVYDRHASLQIGADMALDLADHLTLLNDTLLVLQGASESNLPLGDINALVTNLHRDLNSPGPEGRVRISAGTVFALARLQLEMIEVKDYGAMGIIEGALRLQNSPGDPDAWTVLLDGLSDATAAMAGINPLQVKVARELGRRGLEHSFRRIWYDMSGTADKIVEQAEERQKLLIRQGAAPLPLDRLLGPQELSVVGAWRRARFDQRWKVNPSGYATVTAHTSLRRETCIAGRCGSVTLRSGTGRAVGIYSPALKATALKRAHAAAGLGTSEIKNPLEQVWPLRQSRPIETAAPINEPDAVRRAREAQLPCVGDAPGCIRIKPPEPVFDSCAMRGDCPPHSQYWLLFWRRPGGLPGLSGSDPGDEFGGAGAGRPGGFDDGPGGPFYGTASPRISQPDANLGNNPGGVILAPRIDKTLSADRANTIRALISRCDFSNAPTCDPTK